MNMQFVTHYFRYTRILLKMLLMFRGLLSENKIPYSLFEKLKSYVPELSANIPDIEKINHYLEEDISYLNSKEEFLNILKSSKYGRKKTTLIITRNKQRNIRKYYSVKIISYQDIIELDSLRDRVFVIDIDMTLENPNSIEGLLKKHADYSDMTFYYSVKLSSLQ